MIFAVVALRRPLSDPRGPLGRHPEAAAAARRVPSDNAVKGKVPGCRGAYDGIGDRAVTRISGFIRGADGHWERFEETVFTTVFDLAAVREVLLEAGLTPVHLARL